jgi:hypothetical protein
MTTIGSRAANATILCKQGTDFSFEMELKDSNGAVVPLAGSSFQGQVRKAKNSSGVVCAFTVAVNTTTNKVKFSLSNSTTAALAPASNSAGAQEIQYVYDIKWIKADSSIDRPLEGAFIVSAGVTP